MNNDNNSANTTIHRKFESESFESELVLKHYAESNKSSQRKCMYIERIHCLAIEWTLEIFLLPELISIKRLYMNDKLLIMDGRRISYRPFLFFLFVIK